VKKYVKAHEVPGKKQRLRTEKRSDKKKVPRPKEPKLVRRKKPRGSSGKKEVTRGGSKASRKKKEIVGGEL